MVYKPDDDGDNAVNNLDPILQQLVPKSYLVLQKAIKEKVTELKANSKPPFQKKDEFLYDSYTLYCYCVVMAVFKQ